MKDGLNQKLNALKFLVVLNDENIVKSAFSKMENFNVGNIGAQQVVQ